jgi:hypothetical protein
MHRHWGWLVLGLSLTACEPEKAPSLSRDAKVDSHRALEEDLSAPRHPSDGGGRAWLDPAPSGPVVVGSRQRFEIVFEAGALGVVEGGVIFLQPSPFWGWDPPQVESSEAPGYTQVATDALGVELEVSSSGGLLLVEIRGRALARGERLRFTYGAGPRGVRVDRYAESSARIWLAVDGDGDGVRALVTEVPTIDVSAAPPTQLVVTLPSTARPGDEIRLTVAALDALGNSGAPLTAPVTLRAPPQLTVAREIVLSERGLAQVDAVVDEAGIYRVHVIANGMQATSNPLVVREGIPRIVWGDLHGHSQLSDGTGTPDDYFGYARDVAALDVVSLTDHDHWGMQFLDQAPDAWGAILDAVERFEEPGRFVTLPGYEWTNWLHGHRHVLYFDDTAEILSALDPEYETPAQLWDALRGRDALTFAHHSAGGPVSTNWDYLPDARIEPVTEIVSVHGSSEAPDSPRPIYSAVAGNFVRDILDRGAQLGFVGSGDSHDGHPGLAHLGGTSGGLAAIFTEHLTRDGVLEALRNRSVYATNGPRIWLRVWLEDELRFAVAGTAPIDRVDIIRSGGVIESLDAEGRAEWSQTLEIEPLDNGDYVYVRVVQIDGGAAWSSPFFGK